MDSNILDILLDLVIICLFFGIVVCIFMIIRNEWVYRQRTKLLNRKDISCEEALVEYKKYDDYDSMFQQFWCWDVEKMKNGKRE